MKESYTPPYLRRILEECQHRPSLKNLADFYLEASSRHNCRFIYLEFLATAATPRVVSMNQEEVKETLKEYHESTEDVLGRILIIEDLTTDVIEFVGSSLNIDPLFFAVHLHSSRSEKTAEKPDVRLLPSMSKRLKFVSTLYHRPLTVSGCSIPLHMRSDMNVRRKAGFYQRGNEPIVGQVQAIFSATMVPRSGKRWLGKLLNKFERR